MKKQENPITGLIGERTAEIMLQLTTEILNLEPFVNNKQVAVCYIDKRAGICSSSVAVNLVLKIKPRLTVQLLSLKHQRRGKN